MVGYQNSVSWRMAQFNADILRLRYRTSFVSEPRCCRVPPQWWSTVPAAPRPFLRGVEYKSRVRSNDTFTSLRTKGRNKSKKEVGSRFFGTRSSIRNAATTHALLGVWPNAATDMHPQPTLFERCGPDAAGDTWSPSRATHPESPWIGALHILPYQSHPRTGWVMAAFPLPHQGHTTNRA